MNSAEPSRMSSSTKAAKATIFMLVSFGLVSILTRHADFGWIFGFSSGAVCAWAVGSGNSGTVRARRQDLFEGEMTRPPGGFVGVDEASAFEDSIKDSCRHIFVV